MEKSLKRFKTPALSKESFFCYHVPSFQPAVCRCSIVFRWLLWTSCAPLPSTVGPDLWESGSGWVYRVLWPSQVGQVQFVNNFHIHKLYKVDGVLFCKLVQQWWQELNWKIITAGKKFREQKQSCIIDKEGRYIFCLLISKNK